MRVTRAIPAGSITTITDFELTGCGVTKPNRAVRYDAHLGAGRAIRDLQPGEMVAALPAFALPAIRPGQHLYVRAQSGPVVVEREVVALQPVRPGGRLFVRAADGAVFSADLSEARP